MGSPFIKICGLSTPETVDAAVRAGANAVGFVFAPSPRLVSPEQAGLLADRVPGGIETVGVFRGQAIDEVLATARTAGVTTIQFHGSEPYDDVARAQAAGFRTLRAFAVEEFRTLSENERARWEGERLLIDAVTPGSGVPFDPALLSGTAPDGWWLLAGGLTPDNVRGLVQTLRPDGVDVSSGVEVTRGVKSAELIERFISEARSQATES